MQGLANQFRRRAREYPQLSSNIQDNLDKVIRGLTEKALQREELRYRIQLMGTIVERPIAEMSSFFSSPHNEVASTNAIRIMDNYNRKFRDEQINMMVGTKRGQSIELKERKFMNPEDV